MNLMFSTVFPKGMSCAGEPTDFPAKIRRGEKTTTIRRGLNWMKHDGKQVTLCHWSGTPYRSPVVRFATANLYLQKLTKRVALGEWCCSRRKTGYEILSDFVLADTDGLTVEQFVEWFSGVSLGEECSRITFVGVRAVLSGPRSGPDGRVKDEREEGVYHGADQREAGAEQGGV